MEIRQIQVSDFKQAGMNSKDNFFGSVAWLEIQGKGCQSYGMFKGTEMVASFHLYHYTRLGKHFLINPPMSPHCGFQARLSGEKMYSRQSEMKRLLTAMAQFLKTEYKSAFFDFSFPPEVIDVQPFQWKGFHALPRYTYLLHLDRTEEELLKQMSTERRKNIRNALEAGYEVSANSNQDAVVSLVGLTLKKAGAPFNPDLLRSLLDIGDDEVYSLVISKNGKPLSAVVTVHDAHRAYYIAGGHSADNGDALAGTLALWMAIHEAQMCGCKQFDFLGSSVPAIEKYFRAFGAELTPCFGIQTGGGIVGWLQKQKRKIKSVR